MVDMQSARHWARALQEKALSPGGVAVDATMGNGGDTLALCQLAGPEGKVYAFDVQPQALESTRLKLEDAGFAQRAQLFLTGHENMAALVPPGVDLIVFNLGWLPGSPHELTTQTQTTLKALSAAFSLLKKGALITLCAYPGHDEGAREMQAVLAWARSLCPDKAQVMVQQYLDQPNAPALIAIVKRKNIC